ncbi:hypothetical protein [Halarcobacter ebronensis]|uniref:Flagellar hook-length control protein-like C-terminal domain-containing protein n=1 Tax=Halarcobacter ebronensis TaxID=1462615 RepID=A0A4Q1AWR7_9BACT|nr:hypothetical protein [Halarcobacter ebronensis]QKF82892.1 flagellar hook-length control protein FliK [Halarcobacter ebronensis]RXK06909.1 hypothetical protein CRV07_05635 [Halarcobacter ebronensis]
MTKEIDFLSILKSDNTTAKTTKSSEKEGASLFDTLLKSSKDEVDNKSNNDQSSDKTKNLSNQTINGDEKIEENRSSTIKNDKNIEESQDSENNTKSTKSGKSFLDRLILEANKNSELQETDLGSDNIKTTKNNTETITNLVLDEENNKSKTTKENINDTSSTQTNKSEKLDESSLNTENNKNDTTKKLLNEKISSDEKSVDSDLNTNKTNLETDTNIEEDKDSNKSLDKSETLINKDKSQELATKDINLVNKENTTSTDIESSDILKDGKEIKDSSLTNQNNKNESENIKTTNDNESLISKAKTQESINKENISLTDIKSSDTIENGKEIKSSLSSNNQDIKNKVEVSNKNIIDNDEEVKNNKSLESKNLVNKNKIQETEIKDSSTTTKSTNLNLNGAEEISKKSFDSESLVSKDERINLDKKALSDTKNIETKENKTTNSSFLDKLIQDSEEINLSKNPQNQNTTTQKSTDIVTNIFLSTQKGSVQSQLMANKSDNVKMVKDANSLKDVKEGADGLDLGLDSLDVATQEAEIEPETPKKLNRDNNSLLSKLALNTKNINTSLITEDTVTNQTTTSISDNSLTSDEQTVNLNVNSSLATSIHTKIIGARQQMASMMSDVARSMYENYKPPVTAFRINLTPAFLGSIAILMRNNKENSLTINMTMSQSTTHDSMIENQSMLRDALHKTFNSNENNNNQTSFDLNFGKDDGNNSNKSTFSDLQEENNQTTKKHSSEEIVESIIENQDFAEDMNYM